MVYLIEGTAIIHQQRRGHLFSNKLQGLSKLKMLGVQYSTRSKQHYHARFLNQVIVGSLRWEPTIM